MSTYRHIRTLGTSWNIPQPHRIGFPGQHGLLGFVSPIAVLSPEIILAVACHQAVQVPPLLPTPCLWAACQGQGAAQTGWCSGIPGERQGWDGMGWDKHDGPEHQGTH